MASVSYVQGLGAEGVLRGRCASALIDASAADVTINWATAFNLIEPAEDASPAVINLTETPGPSPIPALRYILIQPQDADCEILIGNQEHGIKIAQGDRYALTGIHHDITIVEGPEKVYIEVSW
jgi:hypothetical protein